MRAKDGFTLVELMIVVAVILVLAALAIPNLLRSRMNANEIVAIGALRMISAAEIAFQSSFFLDEDGDNVGDFARLGPAGVVGTLANPAVGSEPFVDAVLATGVKSGYSFSVVPIEDGNGDERYVATANPVTQGRTGVRRFYMNERGVITYTADGTVPNVNSMPVQ